jgi:hypothetical protein
MELADVKLLTQRFWRSAFQPLNAYFSFPAATACASSADFFSVLFSAIFCLISASKAITGLSSFRQWRSLASGSNGRCNQYCKRAKALGPSATKCGHCDNEPSVNDQPDPAPIGHSRNRGPVNGRKKCPLGWRLSQQAHDKHIPNKRVYQIRYVKLNGPRSA